MASNSAATGNWQLPDTLTIRSNGELRTFEDVLVGEAWICSGQSNMFWPVELSLDPDLETAAARYDRLRLCQVPVAASTEPRHSAETEWLPCLPETVPKFSAVAYYYGRTLQNILQVPIGLIHSSVGGTPAEAWTPVSELNSHDVLRPMVVQWEIKADEYDPIAVRRALDKALKTWKSGQKKPRQKGRTHRFDRFSWKILNLVS